MILDRTFIAIARDPGAATQGILAKRVQVSQDFLDQAPDWEQVRRGFYALPGTGDCELLAIVEIDNAAEANVWLEGEEARGL